MSITNNEKEMVVEPISPYDDLFSDDIIPPKPSEPVQEKPPVKGPYLSPDDDLEGPETAPKKQTFSLPVSRELIFLAGIAIIGIVIIMVLFFLPGPSSDTESAGQNITQIPVPENTSSIQEETTPVPAVPVSKSEGYTMSDDFSDRSSGWGEYDSDTYMRYYSQGEYHMVQKGEDMSDRALLGNDAENFITEVKARLDSGPLTGQYGILFRFSDDNYYLFGINGRGWFTVKKHVDGKVYELIPLTETYILNKGYVTNKLGVKADGNTLSLYINGKMVRAISDTSLTHGDVGFFVSRLAEEGYIKEQSVSVAFDDFKYGEIS